MNLNGCLIRNGDVYDGTGSPPHLAAELLKITTGIDMQHIPYKGGGAVLPDLIAGRVSMFFGSIATLRPHVESGRVRAVGMSTTQRAAAMPDVPTFVESGLAGYEVNGWYGVLTTVTAETRWYIA